MRGNRVEGGIKAIREADRHVTNNRQQFSVFSAAHFVFENKIAEKCPPL